MSEASRIVHVGDKEISDREAKAEAVLSLTPEACAQLIAGTPKGDPIEAARIAGIMATKRAPDLLPFCHPIVVTGAEVTCEADASVGRIVVTATVRAMDRTGVEMEALTAATVGALCLYDTAKPYDRAARIDGIRLLEKKGGKSGHYVADPA
jgi:cyclic pyranopterin phosphate synthase